MSTKQKILRGNFFTEAEYDRIIENFQPGDFILQNDTGTRVSYKTQGLFYTRGLMGTEEPSTKPAKKKRSRGRRSKR